jgi:hypothetical protein
VLLCAVHYFYQKLTGHGLAWQCDQECAVVCSTLFVPKTHWSWISLAVRPGMRCCVQYIICTKNSLVMD